MTASANKALTLYHSGKSRAVFALNDMLSHLLFLIYSLVSTCRINRDLKRDNFYCETLPHRDNVFTKGSFADPIGFNTVYNVSETSSSFRFQFSRRPCSSHRKSSMYWRYSAEKHTFSKNGSRANRLSGTL